MRCQFGHLWQAGPNAASNAIGYAKFYIRSHDVVIRVYNQLATWLRCTNTQAISENGEFYPRCDWRQDRRRIIKRLLLITVWLLLTVCYCDCSSLPRGAASGTALAATVRYSAHQSVCGGVPLSIHCSRIITSPPTPFRHSQSFV